MDEIEVDRFPLKGFVWQCACCGKIARGDQYGDEKSDYGWDVSCVMNSHLVKEEEAIEFKKKYNEAFQESLARGETVDSKSTGEGSTPSRGATDLEKAIEWGVDYVGEEAGDK